VFYVSVNFLIFGKQNPPVSGYLCANGGFDMFSPVVYVRIIAKSQSGSLGNAYRMNIQLDA
jgi:hypothetical protein